VHFRTGPRGKRPLNILEATGSGCGLLDYDGDGLLDLVLIGQPRCALYRNLGEGGFADRTREAGLEREGIWTGCAAGDIDNDGDIDLVVTGYGGCALYRNLGDGRFREVGAASGLRAGGFQTSAVLADLDRDGYLDLYVCRYVRFGPREPQYCPSADGSIMRACGPDAYAAELGVYYHNNRDGTFSDRTQAAGLGSAHGKAWGAVAADLDADGWQDLYVANDEMPGDLFHNLGGGRFVNRGAESGTAFSRDGGVQGGMGVDAGDYDDDGRLDLVVTNFWMEPNALYHNDGDGLFLERSRAAGLAAATAARVGFGTRFVDVDGDGRLDLFFANGHVQDIHWVDPAQGMPELLQLFRNVDGKRFEDRSNEGGQAFLAPITGRGTAVGDWDNDGDPDLVVTDLEGSPLLLRNDGTPADRGYHWLGLELRSRTRDALGARVTVQSGSRTWVRECQSGGSVLSAQDPRVLVGLGTTTRVDRLTVRWPDGRTDVHSNPPLDRYLLLRRGGAISFRTAPRAAAGYAPSGRSSAGPAK
jgi:hypothetical protein